LDGDGKLKLVLAAVLLYFLNLGGIRAQSFSQFFPAEGTIECR